MMTPEEHQYRHETLHHAFDELAACYLEEGFQAFGLGPRRTSIHDEIFDLMRWSHQKTLLPSPVTREHQLLWPAGLIAQTDDPELLEWLSLAAAKGGGFVSSIANAGLRADPENYAMLRLVLMVLRRKYPEYEPSDAVKRELAERLRG
jgi:hypothetical protein